jgi:hypothetical protein
VEKPEQALMTSQTFGAAYEPTTQAQPPLALTFTGLLCSLFYLQPNSWGHFLSFSPGIPYSSPEMSHRKAPRLSCRGARGEGHMSTFRQHTGCVTPLMTVGVIAYTAEKEGSGRSQEHL